METTTLGRTGLTVTPVGLGLAALGRPAYVNLGRDLDLGRRRSVEAMEHRCHQALDCAHGVGVRYFDAARSYGVAERFLASWLRTRALEPRGVTVGSKWGYRYVGDWRLQADVHEIKDHSLAALRRQYRESKELLGDHLCLYQIHSAALDTGVLTDYSVLSELAAITESGLFIGLSLSGPDQKDTLRRALEAEVDGINPFSCVQATFNLLEPTVGDALKEADDAGWGVIVKEALANGRLTSSNTDSSFTKGMELLDGIARRLDTTRDALAIAWVLTHDFVSVALSGAVTPEQLESNLGSLDLKLSADDHSTLAELEETSDDYWTRRRALPWT